MPRNREGRCYLEEGLRPRREASRPSLNRSRLLCLRVSRLRYGALGTGCYPATWYTGFELPAP
jgi:hypothetical protein